MPVADEPLLRGRRRQIALVVGIVVAQAAVMAAWACVVVLAAESEANTVSF